MTLNDLDTLYGVNTEKWMSGNEVRNTDVEVIEQTVEMFVGWYSMGPFIATIHIKDGEVKTLITEV